MAQPFTRGAVHVYCGFGSNHSPQYLGTGLRAPKISFRRNFAPAWNDLAGVGFPFDYSYQGKEAFVSVQLTRWNEAVLQQAQDTIGAGVAAAPGSDARDAIGSLMVLEGLTLELWLVYSYGPGQIAAVPAMAAMPAGYHFFTAFLEDPEDLEGGTDPASHLLTFHCVRAYDPSTGQFNLYDNVIGGLPTPD